jgi:hypothetical protein
MMLPLLALLQLGQSPPASPRSAPDLRLWYRQPAERWNQALPVGNGRRTKRPDRTSETRLGRRPPEQFQ